LRTTVLTTTLATTVLFGYWGLFTWLPGFLSAPASQGGAGLSIVRTSAWVFLMQGGAFAGYLLFGWLSDKWGRRPAFAFYCAAAALVVPVYGFAPRWAGSAAEFWLLAIGPLVGFFGTGYFSLFGAMLAELYPTASRGAGLGFAYNVGRGVAALAPFAVGALGDRYGLGPALALSSGFYLLGAMLVYTLPETRSTVLR
jgi:MFS family permease